ncbi:MAG: hypothetical protein JNJ90_04350 [Saprospiraceae bacterium]|jgi:hypothetical protein|nr:hypothetical protein [Saprospiraceae bacterium]
MNVQQLVEALDARILKGDITGAFNEFAADNCTTLSNSENITRSKDQKLEILNWFFQNIASVNRIERPALQVAGDVTESQFVFDFMTRQGENLVYNEVIRRTWKNGKMVEEQYLVGQTIGAPKTSAAKKPSKNEVAQDVQPAAAKPAPKAEPKAAKPAAKAAPKAVEAKPAKAVAAPKAEAKPAAKADKTKAGRK